jgi:hypothetical protein
MSAADAFSELSSNAMRNTATGVNANDNSSASRSVANVGLASSELEELNEAVSLRLKR